MGIIAFKSPFKPKAVSIFSTTLAMLFQLPAMAQQKQVTAQQASMFSSPAFIIMLSIILVLLVAILSMATAVKAAAEYRISKEKDKKNTGVKNTLLILALVSCTHNLWAQNTTEPAPAVPFDYWGLGATAFFSMAGVILLELIMVWVLRNIAMQLLNTGETQAAGAVKPVKAKPALMERLNASVSIEKEEEIMLDHEYDGIRELDNNLPPWWKYGFYVSIVFAFVYLIHFHVLGTGKLQDAEYRQEVTNDSIALVEYRKKAANLVDENNVTQLTDGSSLASGKKIFLDNCAACHGKLGEGTVGPNLTDEYWLHGGSIQDIFRSVKYGWPEKGMKSWQQDLGAKQIHEISSYIKTLKGTNPPNAKEKQGELYVDENTAPADSTKVSQPDTTAKSK